MSSPSILERAYELARSGGYSTITQIRDRLGKEGYIHISSYLEGRAVQKALKKLMSEARARVRSDRETGTSAR